ncbi:hypothetical protein GH733_019370 [Mirounga leonina]|nr:hypothetical protein GH733_019370 [Mirounga leonina]
MRPPPTTIQSPLQDSHSSSAGLSTAVSTAKSSKKKGFFRPLNEPLTSTLATPNPGNPPASDWAYYKANVAKAGLVEDFEKKFNALKFPVPEDKHTVQVDAKEKENVKSCAECLSLSKAGIEECEKELEKMQNIIPFDQMTIEHLNEVFPETKLDKRKPFDIILILAYKLYMKETSPEDRYAVDDTIRQWGFETFRAFLILLKEPQAPGISIIIITTTIIIIILHHL